MSATYPAPAVRVQGETLALSTSLASLGLYPAHHQLVLYNPAVDFRLHLNPALIGATFYDASATAGARFLKAGSTSGGSLASDLADRASPGTGTLLDAMTTSDYLYLCFANVIGGVRVVMTASVNGEASVMTGAYYDGSAWTSLSVTDGTIATGATLAVTGSVTWTAPTDWKPASLGGGSGILTDANALVVVGTSTPGLNPPGTYGFWMRISVGAALGADVEIQDVWALNKDTSRAYFRAGVPHLLSIDRRVVGSFEAVLAAGTDTLQVTGSDGSASEGSGTTITQGMAAEDAAVVGNPLLAGGRYDSTARALETGDVGALAIDVAARQIVVGAAAEDAAVAGDPVLIAGRYDSTARALETGDVGTIAVDVGARPQVVGPAAENAAVVGGPVLLGGRYDASDRTLGDGDVGAVAVDVAGKLKLSATITGSNTVQDDAGNTNVQAKGDDRGVQYQRSVGQEPIRGRSLTVPVAVTGTFTTAIQLTAKDYLCDQVAVVFRNRNTDAEGLVGDVVAQTLELKKGEPLPLGAVDPKNVYLKAHTTAGDDADAILTLRDRPDYRDMLLQAIAQYGGAYWPFQERSGTALVDVGLGTKGPHDLLLSGATVADAGVFGLGLDMDGSNDTVRQKSEATNSGTVSIVDTPTFTLDDTGAVFTAAIRDGNHWVIIKDATGTRASAYIGTSDVDADSTKVQLYTTTARGTLGYAASETGWDPTDTPLTFTVHKELHTVGSFSLGLWFWNDTPTVLGQLASIDPNVTNKKTFYLLTLATRKYDATVFSSTSVYTAASTNLGRAVEAAPVFISMTFEASTRVTLYVNGREEAENVTSIPATTNQPLTPLCLGAQNVLVTAANFANGRLSHPFYIRAAMKDNWHRSLYEAGRR